MRNIISFTIAFLVLILLSGCDDIGFGSNGRYSGDKDSSGNYLILDTKTGDVRTIQNGQLIKILEEEQISKIKWFQSQTIPGMSVEIEYIGIKYRDGMCHYQGIIRPKVPNDTDSQSSTNNPQDKKTEFDQKEIFENLEGIWEGSSLDSPRQITIKLADTRGFNIMSFQITRRGINRIVDQNGDPVHLSFEGSSKISPTSYQSIAHYTLSWNLAEWGSQKKKK